MDMSYVIESSHRLDFASQEFNVTCTRNFSLSQCRMPLACSKAPTDEPHAYPGSHSASREEEEADRSTVVQAPQTHREQTCTSAKGLTA